MWHHSHSTFKQLSRSFLRENCLSLFWIRLRCRLYQPWFLKWIFQRFPSIPPSWFVSLSRHPWWRGNFPAKKSSWLSSYSNPAMKYEIEFMTFMLIGYLFTVEMFLDLPLGTIRTTDDFLVEVWMRDWLQMSKTSLK